jgi:hypothetical protein
MMSGVTVLGEASLNKAKERVLRSSPLSLCPTAVESPDDLCFALRSATVGSGLQHEGTMRTVRLVAAIALVARLGLAACDDLIAVTRGARHGNESHGPLLSMVQSLWPTAQ